MASLLTAKTFFEGRVLYRHTTPHGYTCTLPGMVSELGTSRAFTSTTFWQRTRQESAMDTLFGEHTPPLSEGKHGGLRAAPDHEMNAGVCPRLHSKGSLACYEKNIEDRMVN
jgi:hypothetical protein